MAANDDLRTVFDKTADAVRSAAEVVQLTTESIAGAIDDSRRPGGMLAHVSRVPREAPLRALALAFVTGWIVSRRLGR